MSSAARNASFAPGPATPRAEPASHKTLVESTGDGYAAAMIQYVLNFFRPVTDPSPLLAEFRKALSHEML